MRINSGIKTKKTISELIFDYSNILLMLIVAVVTIYPFLNILAISLNESVDSVRGGIHIIPRKFTFANYISIFTASNLTTAFIISILRTVIGTITGLFSTFLVAFVLSRKDFVSRRLFSAIFVITMYISGGLIPDFILTRNLGLMNNFMVYIIPNLIWVWNLFVLRSYIESLPYSLQESAKLDGANDFTIMAKIIFPLCLPVIATIALFITVGQWNSWFDTYLYCGNNKSLSTLQFELMKILQSAQSQVSSSRMAHQSEAVLRHQVSPESIKMAITIVATVPILLVYPFLQKYFVSGLTLGAIKS